MNELWHSAALSMLLARLTCWLLTMIHTTSIYASTWYRNQPVYAIRCMIGSRNKISLRKNCWHIAIFRVSKRLYHWCTYISSVIECSIEYLIKYFEYYSSAVIELIAVQMDYKEYFWNIKNVSTIFLRHSSLRLSNKENFLPCKYLIS